METLKLPSEIFRNIVLTGNKIKRVHWEVWSRQMAVRKVRNIPPEETWQIGRSSSFKVWSWNASGTLYITQQSQIQWDWMQARWGPKKLKEKEMMMMEEWLPWSLLQLKKVAIKGDECVGICQNGCYILKCLCLLYKNGTLFFISVMQILAFISVLFLLRHHLYLSSFIQSKMHFICNCLFTYLERIQYKPSFILSSLFIMVIFLLLLMGKSSE